KNLSATTCGLLVRRSGVLGRTGGDPWRHLLDRMRRTWLLPCRPLRWTVLVEFLPSITEELPMAVSVTSKGQVTIPKRIRDALGITPGSKVEFDVAGGGARLKLVKRHASSRIDEAAAILDYRGPRIGVDKMHGGLARKKAAKRARR